MVIIFVRNAGKKGLWFDLESPSKMVIFRSGYFKTICQLELALLALWDIAKEPESATLTASTGQIRLGSTNSRRRVAVGNCDSPSDLLRAIGDIPSATVADERPKDRRRTDLTGPLCDLIH